MTTTMTVLSEVARACEKGLTARASIVTFQVVA